MIILIKKYGGHMARTAIVKKIASLIVKKIASMINKKNAINVKNPHNAKATMSIIRGILSIIFFT
jgi:hypothetical protein